MIDLHTHILPGVDDGAATSEESLAMLTESARQGVKVCVATPHCMVHKESDIKNFEEKRQQSYEALRAAAGNATVPLLLLGAEVYLDNDIGEYQEIERLCIGESRYMLVEFPVVNQNRNTADWLYRLLLKGIKPIIAHIDRYPEQQELIESFEGLQLTYQINASRFLTMGGRRVVRSLLKENKKFVVSSDMHNTTTRCSQMEAAFTWMKKKNPDLAEELFYKNALRIVFGESRQQV